MNTTEIKKELYKQKPIAEVDFERRSVASSESRKKAGRKTTKKLLDCVKEWNEIVDGKFTLKALSEKSKVSYKTVLRRKKEINNLYS